LNVKDAAFLPGIDVFQTMAVFTQQKEGFDFF
jgi:hypothetical protein